MYMLMVANFEGIQAFDLLQTNLILKAVDQNFNESAQLLEYQKPSHAEKLQPDTVDARCKERTTRTDRLCM